MTSFMLNVLFPLASLGTDTAPRKASDVLNDVMPGVITLAVVAVWLGLIGFGRIVPEQLSAILQVVIGFYFGQHVAMAAARGIITSNAQTTANTIAATKAATEATAATVAAVTGTNGASKP